MNFILNGNTCETGGSTFGTLYFRGGYHSLPDGCTVWGTSVDRTNRFIGDLMGNIVLEYTDGSTEKVPLVFGYTLWFRTIWREECAPFRSEYAEKEYADALRETLCLCGAYEGTEECCLAVMTAGKPLRRIVIEGNTAKNGFPVFTEVGTEPFCGDSGFYGSHTVNSADPFPERTEKLLHFINRRLLTYEDDYKNPPEYDADRTNNGFSVRFTGDDDAAIATGVFAENLAELAERSDGEGFVHTSGKYAPTWWYDGFGPWLMNVGNYYGDYYSRDAGRALMTLIGFGKTEEARRGIEYGNRLMMYFPENHITFNGIPVPGHCPVVMNKPMFYSEILSVSGWPTKYTEERFGADHGKLGNQETDGHGLMMMANVALIRALPDGDKWAEEHWDELCAYAEWILWCFENPAISLAGRGLLYAESEAGMNAYTMYCNIPCCLGLVGLSKIAESLGKTADAEEWAAAAEKMKTAITREFSENGKWRPADFGFFHDPAVTFSSDFYGYDPADLPEEWEKLSRAVYEDDALPRRCLPYDASGGVGYNSSMITQNSLLLDMTADADMFFRRLTRLCYAPRLPMPYIAPEGASYSFAEKAVRRQGDLGNLVQMAEVLKTFGIIIGISPVSDGKLKIFPRLPHKWGCQVGNYPVTGTGARLSLAVTYPENGRQNIDLSLSDRSGTDTVSVRFGPFREDEKTVLTLNGKAVGGVRVHSGDAYWEEVTVNAGEIHIGL